MQFYSFDTRDPVFDVAGFGLSAQFITTENTYGISGDRITVRDNSGSWTIEARELTWAGGQERAPGTARIDVRAHAGGLRLDVHATAPHPLRCVKIILRGLPSGRVGRAMSGPSEIPAEGYLSSYPREMPIWYLQPDDEPLYVFYAQDPEVRAKRFAAYPDGDGTTVELIFEEDARKWRREIAAAPWMIQRHDTLRPVIDQHLAFLENAYGLKRWEERPDVPDWARQLALMLNIHGMHWCGYVFNTYDRMADILRWVCQRIEGRRVIAHLAGWEGRYYWQYGDFRPDPRLGGREGFSRLCDTARSLGAHLMPMFGGNCANAWFPGFERYGVWSHLRTGTGLIEQGNKPDWDGSRSHDTGWQAWLNPGATGWQEHLVRQIHELTDDYGFDAVYLDTIHFWTNDPVHSVFEGTKRMAERIRELHPDMLVTCENWYDALLAVFPIHQGDVPEDDWMDPYIRHYTRLCEGEPSRGSTGVHEWGSVPYRLYPVREIHWPTVSFVEDTLDKSPREVEEVIQQAHTYVQRFLRRFAE